MHILYVMYICYKAMDENNVIKTKELGKLKNLFLKFTSYL